jgi:hypothetical protein
MRREIIGLVWLVLGLALGCGSSSRPAATAAKAAAPVVTAAVHAQPPASAAPSPAEPPSLPVMSSAAFAQGARIADMAAVRSSAGMLVAWVTYVGRPPDTGKGRRKNDGPAASVVVRALDEHAEPVRPATAVSSRADPVGGVAIRAAAGGDEACVAWTGIDQGRSQVFLTRVAADGQKKGQRMVSRGKGAASDVALAATPDGWVVGWVETRDDEVEVHATKVSAKLDKVGADRIVTRHGGDASETQLLVRAEKVLVVWADARRGQGSSDLYTARLALSDLDWRGDETRLSSIPDYARGLSLVADADGALLGWIEKPPREQGSAPYVAEIARLDASGRLQGPPEKVALGAAAGSIGIGCGPAECRVVLATAGGDALGLWGLESDRSGPMPRPRKIASVEGVATEDVSLNVLGEWVFFAEDNLKGEGRIRALHVGWP